MRFKIKEVRHLTPGIRGLAQGIRGLMLGVIQLFGSQYDALVVESESTHCN